MPGGALKSLARKAGVWEVLASHCRSLCGLPVCRLGAHLGPLHQACLGAPLPQAAHHQAWAHRKLYSSGPHEVEGPGGLLSWPPPLGYLSRPRLYAGPALPWAAVKIQGLNSPSVKWDDRTAVYLLTPCVHLH